MFSLKLIKLLISYKHPSSFILHPYKCITFLCICMFVCLFVYQNRSLDFFLFFVLPQISHTYLLTLVPLCLLSCFLQLRVCNEHYNEKTSCLILASLLKVKIRKLSSWFHRLLVAYITTPSVKIVTVSNCCHFLYRKTTTDD